MRALKKSHYLDYHPCPLLTQAGKPLGNHLFPRVKGFTLSLTILSRTRESFTLSRTLPLCKGEPERVVVSLKTDFFSTLVYRGSGNEADGGVSFSIIHFQLPNSFLNNSTASRISSKRIYSFAVCERALSPGPIFIEAQGMTA